MQQANTNDFQVNGSHAKLAFLGPLGTYTHEASYKVFGKCVEYVEQRTVTDVFRSLASSSSQLGVVPQENTIFGSVIETYDLLRTMSDSAFVCGDVVLEVQHCLLVRKGVKPGDIERIMSHEQALGQCSDFITNNFPHAALEKKPSTAAAARALLNAPANCAAICSRLCATLFEDLEVLYEGIQNESANFTRFYILAHNKSMPIPFIRPPGPERRALLRMFTTPKATGPTSILPSLQALDTYVARIDRRPSSDGVPFRDIYFVELEGEERLAAECGNTKNEDRNSWAIHVEKAAERVRRVGGEVTIVGLW